MKPNIWSTLKVATGIPEYMLLPSLGTGEIIWWSKNFPATLLKWSVVFIRNAGAPTLTASLNAACPLVMSGWQTTECPGTWHMVTNLGTFRLPLLEGVWAQLCAMAHPLYWMGQQAYPSFLGRYLKSLRLGFPGGTVVKNPPANAGDMGSTPGPGRSHMPRSN